MNKKKVALVLALGLTGASANASVFIDEHSNAMQSEAINKVVASEAADIGKIVKAKPKAKKSINTTNKISTIDYQQKISVFNHIGKKAPNGKIQGFANDISIREALENVVPEDWKIEVNEKVDLTKKVNFAGGETWNDTIERIGKDNFSATVNWNDKTLKVVPIDTRYKADTVAVTEDVAGIHNGIRHQKQHIQHPKKVKKVVKSVAVKNTAVSSTAMAAKSTGGTWVLNKNYTLRQNLEMWAKKAGWTLSWKAPDYNVIANATFTGAIDSEDGPIISILKHYEDATLPLKVSIMGGNKVISVESRNYMPRDVVDLSTNMQ